jgi:hypothetical protein
VRSRTHARGGLGISPRGRLTGFTVDAWGGGRSVSLTDVVSESPDGVRKELGQVWVKVRDPSRAHAAPFSGTHLAWSVTTPGSLQGKHRASVRVN